MGAPPVPKGRMAAGAPRASPSQSLPYARTNEIRFEGCLSGPARAEPPPAPTERGYHAGSGAPTIRYRPGSMRIGRQAGTALLLAALLLAAACDRGIEPFDP